MDFTLTPLTAHLGAEIRGLDLAGPVSADTRTALNRAFVAHAVLVFRDQALSPHQLLEAVQLFGTVFPQHNARYKIADCPMVHYISNQDTYADGTRYIPGEGYHTDHSNDARPHAGPQGQAAADQAEGPGRGVLPLGIARVAKQPTWVWRWE